MTLAPLLRMSGSMQTAITKLNSNTCVPRIHPFNSYKQHSTGKENPHVTRGRCVLLLQKLIFSKTDRVRHVQQVLSPQYMKKSENGNVAAQVSWIRWESRNFLLRPKFIVAFYRPVNF